MTLKPVRILAVGRLRTPHWKSAVDHYAARLNRWRDIREICVKDGDPALPIPDRNADEGKRLLAALAPSDIPICLDERGKTYASRDFSRFLAELSENASKVPCFIIGGAFGLDPAVRAAAKHLLSFGPLTLPHELARVVLYEQLYRAEAVLRGVPYHH